ncbi:Translation initiation factor eIF-2B subunit delta [Dirofilaria immitis]|nr:Translation initiation factor eIF-2B subunit delta [Dirofilaria immitis]
MSIYRFLLPYNYTSTQQPNQPESEVVYFENTKFSQMITFSRALHICFAQIGGAKCSEVTEDYEKFGYMSTGNNTMNVDDEDKRDKFFGQVSKSKGIRSDVVATEVVRLFDAAVDCLKICLSLLTSDMDHVSKRCKKKLIMEIENLQIDDKTNKPSSHFNKTPKELEELSNGQSERFREKLEWNVELKLLKQEQEKKNECSMSDNPGQQRVKPFKFMKDPGFPSGFESLQPFRTVHFGTDILVFIMLSCKIGNKEGSSKQPMFCETIAPNIHPSFLEFASRCEAKHITGVDAVCVAFVQSIKQFLSDYIISPNQVMSRDLEQAIRQQLNCLTKNGKHSFPLVLGNLVKQLKRKLVGCRIRFLNKK